MGEAPTYEIVSVHDFLKVPEDRRAICLREFGVWLAMAESVATLFAGIPVAAPSSFIWIDDDKHTMSMSVRAGEEEVFSASGVMTETPNAE